MKDLSEEIEASGDSVVLAEAIGYVGEGLFAIARAIERLASDGTPEEEEGDYYLDGKRKR